MNYNLITILGPTATGKTKLAAQLAYKYNGEIISADSRQVYKKMDIGTGKDYTDYIVNDTEIPYHLIDIAEPETEFNLYFFIEKFKEVFKIIISKKKIPFLTGGTGLYISSVIQNYQLKKAGYDEDDIKQLAGLSFEELKSVLLDLKPKLHNRTDLENKERLIKAILVAGSGGETLLKEIKISSLVLGVKYERKEIRERITFRLKKRLNEGMIEEIRHLINSGVTYERLLSLGLEYRFIALFIKGEISYNEMYAKLNTAIHAFAKRQMTWFRKMEREGVRINWIDKADFKQAAELISQSNFIPQFKL